MQHTDEREREEGKERERERERDVYIFDCMRVLCGLRPYIVVVAVVVVAVERGGVAFTFFDLLLLSRNQQTK